MTEPKWSDIDLLSEVIAFFEAEILVRHRRVIELRDSIRGAEIVFPEEVELIETLILEQVAIVGAMMKFRDCEKEGDELLKMNKVLTRMLDHMDGWAPYGDDVALPIRSGKFEGDKEAAYEWFNRARGVLANEYKHLERRRKKTPTDPVR